MEKVINVTCRGAATIGYKTLIPMQGKLKTLSPENYEKMRKEILELGFSEPISVWANEDKYFILNGHQRLETIRRMIEDEGYRTLDVPINFIQAKDTNEAKRKILALTSQYGTIETDGLKEFLAGTDINVEELLSSFRFADLDLNKFVEENFTETLGDDPLNIEHGGVDSVELPEGPTGPLSHVRMVQLFLSEETQPQFVHMCEALAKIHSTDNVTDTVFAVVREAYERIPVNERVPAQTSESLSQ